jgi:hypothetical protein
VHSEGFEDHPVLLEVVEVGVPRGWDHEESSALERPEGRDGGQPVVGVVNVDPVLAVQVHVYTGEREPR